MTEGDYEKFIRKFWQCPDTGCWLWTGGNRGNGYGVFYCEKRPQAAHRVSHEHFIGPIPEGFDVDHLCRVKRCVNPDHLEAVTRSENLLRARTAKSLGRKDPKTFNNSFRVKPAGFCTT